MTPSAIDELLREQQAVILQERRINQRQTFVRPVRVKRREGDLQVFSRDISSRGISLIINDEMKIGTVAELEIHSIGSGPVILRAELRWSNRFGQGWFATGWHFL